jgi:hypothetical protein
VFGIQPKQYLTQSRIFGAQDLESSQIIRGIRRHSAPAGMAPWRGHFEFLLSVFPILPFPPLCGKLISKELDIPYKT